MSNHAAVLAEFDALIEEGKRLSQLVYQHRSEGYWSMESTRIQDVGRFEQWKYQTATLVDNALPVLDATKAAFVAGCRACQARGVQHVVGQLIGLREAFARNYYAPLKTRVLDEINSGIVEDAEALLQAVTDANAPEPAIAALYAGIALETKIVAMCEAIPSIDLQDGKGKRKQASRLLIELRDCGQLDTSTATRLQTYLDLRNAVAHGNWNSIQVADAEQMLIGVRQFIGGQ